MIRSRTARWKSGICASCTADPSLSLIHIFFSQIFPKYRKPTAHTVGFLFLFSFSASQCTQTLSLIHILTDCDCDKKQIDPRFAALRALLDSDKGE